ncbi:MAG: magnesium/cobalt efflux protein [Rheinheimera sp.]|uniref:HlyC/CorC family transporter n=1 Tax=Arsukibacterium sp. UBA3155 TaxID=1946058 RepID=UPI000C8EAB12|nr:HlyC/CorC family transporter [Arsukibacterium sp. UBA3155]MAD74338.1 magnesium/cobalt efflux protein [Rheinheimera sp.]
MDDISTSALFILLGVLLFLSAYFSGSETGMMSVNPYRLKHLADKNHKGAIRVSELLKRPDRLIGLILIGNNLVNIAAATVTALLGERLYGNLGIVIAPIALTLVVLIFSEVTPKTLAALYPERVAFPSSFILKFLLKIFYPFVWALNKVTNGLLNLLGVSPEKHQGNSLSAEELRTVVYEAGALIPEQHQNMLVGVLDLENATVEDIMIPRNEIVGIDINDEWKDIERQLANFQYSRILMYRDNIDDAIGFVHPRELMRLLIKEQLTKASLLRAASEIYFIPEGTPLNTQLLKFQGAKDRIGLVVDEYGDIQGLVTLADILEEVVGEFTTDIAEETNEDILAQPDGTFLIDGSINLRDLNREMKMSLPTDGPKTLNGLILEYLEEIPQGRLSVKLAGYPMEIVDVQDNMIKTIRLLVNPKKPTSKKPSH